MSIYSRLCLKRSPGQMLVIESPSAHLVLIQFEPHGRLRITAPLSYRILRGELADHEFDLRALEDADQAGRGGTLCLKRNPSESVVIRCPDRETLTLEMGELGKVRIVAPRSYRILRGELWRGPPAPGLAG
jgi:sRNA-binding carbon storage regulator CsrA